MGCQISSRFYEGAVRVKTQGVSPASIHGPVHGPVHGSVAGERLQIEVEKYSRASVHLDCLRAIAALIVMESHWRNLFFVDMNRLSRMQKLPCICWQMRRTSQSLCPLCFRATSSLAVTAQTVAGFSYSLYTVHFPLLLLFAGAVMGFDRW